ncbi:hypothetical protein GALMADRAFT_859122 [Galerina marginata CBS 339.88]|uniref:NAD(P)-binding protein n=1 Tax=Galerina marginata (strain CBS 339.88) TaxID=685588 RepID=A0A067TIF6_GALM3|nr:hypothetical protein GALMADRAFT_859122 [Galerina marginata CBS 339.88]
MGLVYSMTRETFPPKAKYGVDDIPDLSGKVIIVTGGYGGIGKETVKALLAHNAKVYIAARSQEKADLAIAELKQQTGREAHFLQMDLADLSSVQAAATEFLSKEKRLHVLYNNAGVMAPPVEQVTKQEYDMQFGVNVLGHFYFTKLLIPTLISTARTNPDNRARVITTSSALHLLGRINYDTLIDGPKRKKSLKFLLYNQSKYAGVAFASELARKYEDEGIVSVALNPGNLHSDLQRHLSKLELTILNTILFPTSFGALSGLWAGTSAAGAYLNGKYVVPWARVSSPRASAQSAKVGEKLWNWMEEQIEKHEQKSD